MTERYAMFETVIGIEVHVELKTETKIFCSCGTSFGASPNTQVCPVCLGLPGTLPTLNRKVVEYAVKTGLATGCEINEYTRLDRKNYFYPDLPKAYQISQYEFPLCERGHLRIRTDEGEKDIGITRIHIEEDAGKLLHGKESGTMIDYNRCGIPLIEIVSEPDMRSAAEAKAYLSELRTVLLYTGVSDCRMDEGSFRCDVNLSVRKHGETAMGVRTEIKNINSFSFVAKAIEYEAKRQIDLILSGGSVREETRRFDADTGTTSAMRIKENAADYRFFPEPDIPSFRIDRKTVESIAADMPRLPAERRREYVEDYGITPEDADIIISRPQMAEFFEVAAEITKYPRLVANMMISDLLSRVGSEGFDCGIEAVQLGEIAELVGSETVNSSTAKKLIKLFSESKCTFTPSQAVQRMGLAQINDRDLIREVFYEVVRTSPKLIVDYKSGKNAAKKAIVGAIMAKTAGLSNPRIVNELFEEIVKK